MVEKVGTMQIVKEGWLYKQSKYMKEWRKYFLYHKIYRRWVVLTPTHLYSYKEYKKYEKPTEEIVIKECKTIKSVEDEIKRKFAFVFW